MESFDSWPEFIPVKKDDLVEAGLMYTGKWKVPFLSKLNTLTFLIGSAEFLQFFAKSNKTSENGQEYFILNQIEINK
jgi:hypothetical protein